MTADRVGGIAGPRLAAFAILVALLLGLPRATHAQGARTVRPPRFDFTFGGGVVSGVSLGTADANLRANATTLQDYRLFSTDTTLRPAPVIDLRLAGTVTGRLAVEGQVLFGKPELKTEVTNDVESAPDQTVSERVTQVLVAGGVRIRLDSIRRPGSTMPYVSGGAGVLRYTHEGAASSEQSAAFYVGGGVRHLLGSRPGRPGRAGLRGDVQFLIVNGGLSFDDSSTTQLSATGGVFFTF